MKQSGHYLRNLPSVPDYPPEPKQRVVVMFTRLEFAKLCGMASGMGHLTLQEAIKHKLFEEAAS